MSKMLEAVTAARESRDWSKVVEAIPYARYLALSVDHSESDFVCKLPFAERLIGNPGLPALHGGAIGALMESTAVLMLLARMETIVLPKTITLTVDYLLSGRPADTFAAGTITRLGRRVANVNVIAWQAEREKPIATAIAHFLLE